MKKLLNTELKFEFEQMTNEQLTDFKFLSSFIFNKVGLFLSKRSLGKSIKNFENLTCFGGLQCIQYPDELAKLLVFLYQNKKSINSYCEMGIAFGGTFYVVDSFLRAVNPNMKYSLAIDLYCNKLEGFKEYNKKYPTTTLSKIDAIDFIPDQKYDLCLIDYIHSAKNCRISYNSMKNFSNFIAFHDIKYKKYPDVMEFWNKEIKGDKIEFLNEDPTFSTPIGMGLIKILKKD